MGSMEDNLQFSLRVNRVGKGVFDLHIISAFMRRKVIITHGHTHVARNFRTNIFPPDLGPRLNGKPVIFRVVFISADEIGECSLEI